MAKMVGLWGVLLILSSLNFAESNEAPATPINLIVTRQVPSADHGIIATLTWTVPLSTTPLSYYVRYHENNTLHYTQKMTTKTTARLFLRPKSYYVVKVMAIDSQTSTQGKWSDNLKVKTGESVPTHAPVNVTAAAVTSSSILVRWQAIPQEDRNGKLLGYVVFYRRHNTRRWKTTELKNPLIFQYHMNGLSRGDSYVIAVAGYTKIGVGKKSDSVTVDLPAIGKSRSTTKRPVMTTVTQKATVFPSTTAKLANTLKYFNNHIPKETPRNTLVTYEKPSESQPVYEAGSSTVASPNAQANKDIPDEKSTSIGLVYKFIIPSAIGGLIMVMLIICILWRHRKSKRKHHADESIRLTPVSERGKKDKTRCAVTRGEGSIRYAPPTKTYTTSAPPPEDSQDIAQTDETRTKLSVVSENDSNTCNTLNRALPAKPRQPYAEVSIVGNDVKDERYVKRNEHKPVPSSPCKSTTSESGYENMQHLFKNLPDNKGSPLYVNVGTSEDDEVLYEEIPADLKNKVVALKQPLLEKNGDNEVKPEAV